MTFHTTQLANGLTIIGEQRLDAHSAAVGFFVKTGSRDETPEVLGVSHFLEHMLFKGTAKRSAIDLNLELGSIGAQANAFTSEECTVYYAGILPEYFANALDILSDMMRPALRSEDFDTEKGVILEEIALYKDRPFHVLFEHVLEKYFGDHPCGNKVLGTTESITELKVEQMHQYFNRRYSPSNITLAASGNFDWEQLIGLGNEYCGHWIPEHTARLYPPHQAISSDCRISKPDLQKSYVCLAMPGPAVNDLAQVIQAQVLSCIMGDSTGSKTYWQLVQKGLADGAGVEVNDMDKLGMFYAYATTNPENIGQVTGILEHILDDARNFSPQDLERAKTKLASRLVLSNESNMRRLHSLGLTWLYRNQYIPLSDKIDDIRRVSQEDINNLLDVYTLAPRTSVVLTPQ